MQEILNVRIIKIAKINGRYLFHVRLISRSYRIRGRVPRIQINMNARNRVFNEKSKSIKMAGATEEEKRAAVNILIAKIEVYSAINRSAKGPLLYSVLKPETNSDSPSARSNGVRFVSANIVINQIIPTGIARIRGQEINVNEKRAKLNVWVINKQDNRIRAILTSYEIVCATLRSAPRSAYLEFDAHPAERVE